MKKIKVDIKKYSKAMGFELYDAYYEGKNKPSSPFKQGDVVRIHREDPNEDSVGVVLGIIDPIDKELRTDAEGMVAFIHLTHATEKDFKTCGYSTRLKSYLKRNPI